mgnify:CR=1 FL=1
MIPTFPKFKKISRNDRAEILSYTKDFLPYSDYNFNSLWSWDTTGEMRLSILNGNLIVMLPDYISGEPALSFIGNKKLKKTVADLLDYADKKDITSGLTLVPEIAISKLQKKDFKIEEDEDHFDYIFSTKKLSELTGKSFKTKRLMAKRFITNQPEATFKTSLVSNPESHKQILEVLKNWGGKKTKKEDLVLENRAIRRTLMLSKMDKNELLLAGVYLNDELLAFSIDEVLSIGYAISHFFKVKNDYKGVSEYLNQQTAQFLHENGVELWNWEQDLGIEGLKKSKTGYRPVQFLKKYKIQKNIYYNNKTKLYLVKNE